MPARDGALRVLRAARGAGVKRVVLTSSFAAIGYGHKPQTAPFDETDWTDPNADGSGPVREIQDVGRTRGLGFHRPRRRRSRTGRRQSRRRVRPGAGTRLFDFDSPAAADARRRHAGLPAALFRRGRRARCGGSAHPRHERSRRQGRAVSRRRGRVHVAARHGQGAEGRHGCVRQTRADPAIARLAGADHRDRCSGDAADLAGTRQDQEFQQRQGQARAGLGAAFERGVHPLPRPRAWCD